MNFNMNGWKVQKRLARSIGFIFVFLLLIFFFLEWKYESELRAYSSNNSLRNSSCVLTFWYIDRMGLGNAMFIYASLYGISRTLRYPAVIATTGSFKLHSAFGDQLTLPYVRELPLYSPFTDFLMDPEERCCVYNQRNMELLKTACTGPTRLNYYLQSWRYFHKYRDDIRKQFRCPKDSGRLSTILNGENSLRVIYDPARYHLIGVHVRRGDFFDSPKLVSLGYRHSSRRYLVKAMVTMKERLQRLYRTSNRTALFIMLGNDYEWNWANFKDEMDIILVKPADSAFDDYCLLTKLEHTVITVGSYGWWIGYMTGGLVVYDKSYATKATWLDKSMEPDDYFLPEWIPETD